MGMGWVLLTLAVGAQTAEFHLDTDTPDALCPELQLTREAVKVRVGRLDVEGGGTWQGRYSTVHDPTGRRGDFVRLVITDPSGKEQLTRDLPMRGESCATMAQAIALVVDSFFRDFGQSPPHEPLREAPEDKKQEKDSPPATKSEPVVAHDSHPTSGPQAPPSLPEDTRSGVHAGVTIGGAYESVPGTGAAGFGLFVELSKRWRVDVTAALPFSRTSEAYGPSMAYLYPVPIRLSLEYQSGQHAGLTPFIGPELLLSLEHGWASGAPSVHEGWRASLGAGARAGLDYWLSTRFALESSVSLDGVFVQSRRFLAEDEPVLQVSHARLAGMLGLRGVIFP